MIAEFGLALRSRLVEGDPNFRRTYTGLIVNQAIMSADTIRIAGKRSALEHLLVSDRPPLAGGGGTHLMTGIGARKRNHKRSQSISNAHKKRRKRAICPVQLSCLVSHCLGNIPTNLLVDSLVRRYHSPDR